MRVCTLRLDGQETAAVVTAAGIVPVKWINAHLGRGWPTDLLSLIRQGLSPLLARDAEHTPRVVERSAVEYGPLYRHPRKIWGIGLSAWQRLHGCFFLPPGAGAPPAPVR